MQWYACFEKSQVPISRQGAIEAKAQDRIEEMLQDMLQDFRSMEGKETVDDELARQTVELIQLNHCHIHYEEPREPFQDWYNGARGSPLEPSGNTSTTPENPQIWTHLHTQLALVRDTDGGSVARKVYYRLSFTEWPESFSKQGFEKQFPLPPQNMP